MSEQDQDALEPTTAEEAEATAEPPEEDGCAPTLGSSLLAALRTTFIGAVLIGVVEAMAALFAFRKDVGDAFPLSYEFAVVGKMTTSYGVLFGLPLVLLAVLWFALRGKRPNATPEPFLLMMFFALVAIFVAPADILMANMSSLVVGAGALIVLYVGVMAYVGGRILRGRVGRCGVRSLYATTARVACIAWVALAAVFWMSPLRDPATFAASMPAPATSQDERPDVLWIVLDTARADRMSLYGYDKPTTPRLEEWASEAFVYDRAISNAIWTIPTHAAMFTGRSMREHGLGRKARGLSADHKTVAELLTEAGYATACFSNNPLLNPRTTLTRGFEQRHNVFDWVRSVRFSLEYLYETTGIQPPLSWLDQDFGAALTNQMVSNWLQEKSDQPVFAFVNLMEAHLPYRVPSSYRKRYMSDAALPRSYALRRAVHGELEGWLHNTAIIHGYDDMPAVDREAICGQYDAAVEYLDMRIAELIEMFKASGRYDNTLVIVTSDHGEYLDTKGMWSHHFLTYQDVVHIPLLIRSPAKSGGQRIPTPVQLTDLAPTVLHATLGDAGVPNDLQGRNLLADVQAAVVTPAIAEHYGAGKDYEQRLLKKKDREIRHRAARQFAVIESQYKYIWSSDGMRELYDLHVDPKEENNLARSLPLEVQRMQQVLDNWKRRTPEWKPAPGGQSGWSPEVMKDMEALGYVGGEDE